MVHDIPLLKSSKLNAKEELQLTQILHFELELQIISSLDNQCTATSSFIHIPLPILYQPSR